MRILRVLGFAAIVGLAFAAAALLLPHSPAGLRELLLTAGIFAPLIAVATWTVLTPALFPGTVLAAACGLAFGTVEGMALAWGGAVLGGLASFTMARTVARGQVEWLLERSDRLARVHGLLERRGFAAVLAARLMPGIPASGLYYAAGLSPVSRSAFGAAIAVGALLRTTPYVLLGQGLASGSAVTMVVAAASIAVGGAGAMMLLRQLRVPTPAT